MLDTSVSSVINIDHHVCVWYGGASALTNKGIQRASRTATPKVRTRTLTLAIVEPTTTHMNSHQPCAFLGLAPFPPPPPPPPGIAFGATKSAAKGFGLRKADDRSTLLDTIACSKPVTAISKRQQKRMQKHDPFVQPTSTISDRTWGDGDDDDEDEDGSGWDEFAFIQPDIPRVPQLPLPLAPAATGFQPSTPPQIVQAAKAALRKFDKTFGELIPVTNSLCSENTFQLFRGTMGLDMIAYAVSADPTLSRRRDFRTDLLVPPNKPCPYTACFNWMDPRRSVCLFRLPQMSLLEYYREHKPTQLDTLSLMKCVLSAIDFIHEHHHIHGCLTFDCWYTDGDATAKLCIFPLPTLLGGAQKLIKANYRYMSLQALKTNDPTMPDDVWSLGVVLWQILKGGAQPYRFVDSVELMLTVLRKGSALRVPGTHMLKSLFDMVFDPKHTARPTANRLLAHFHLLVTRSLSS
eukprot:m.228318 g.228318  ORF g.228318 m.228318 type:complete len:464 (+) comp15190_c1_seq4:687-2078(+)